jgi:hypothetical protein
MACSGGMSKGALQAMNMPSMTKPRMHMRGFAGGVG